MTYICRSPFHEAGCDAIFLPFFLLYEPFFAGLLDEAKALFSSKQRWDLLIELYQSCGQWDKAIEVSEKHERIHLRRSHYAYARCLEGEGRIDEAIKQYEASETHTVEVPRMLSEAGRLQELEGYAADKKDKDLSRWLARCVHNLTSQAAQL